MTSQCGVLAPFACDKGRPSDGRVRREAEHLGENWGGDLASERGWLVEVWNITAVRAAGG